MWSVMTEDPADAADPTDMTDLIDLVRLLPRDLAEHMLGWDRMIQVHVLRVLKGCVDFWEGQGVVLDPVQFAAVVSAIAKSTYASALALSNLIDAALQGAFVGAPDLLQDDAP